MTLENKISGYVGVAGVRTSKLHFGEIVKLACRIYEVEGEDVAQVASRIDALGAKRRSALVRKNVPSLASELVTKARPPAFGGNRAYSTQKAAQRHVDFGREMGYRP